MLILFSLSYFTAALTSSVAFCHHVGSNLGIWESIAIGGAAGWGCIAKTEGRLWVGVEDGTDGRNGLDGLNPIIEGCSAAGGPLGTCFLITSALLRRSSTRFLADSFRTCELSFETAVKINCTALRNLVNRNENTYFYVMLKRFARIFLLIKLNCCICSSESLFIGVAHIQWVVLYR